MAADDCLGARQAPYPLQGAYHDGDYRCDRPGPRACRGFLQAAYMGDPQAVRLYEQFHLSGTDSAVALDPATRPDHRFLLEGVHAALKGLVAHPDMRPVLGDLPAPLLLLTSSEDRWVAASHAETFASSMPGWRATQTPADLVKFSVGVPQ